MPINLLWLKLDVKAKIQQLVEVFGAAGGFFYITLHQIIYGNEGYPLRRDYEPRRPCKSGLSQL